MYDNDYDNEDEDRDGYLEISNVDKLVNFSRRLIYYNFDDESEKLSDADFFDQVQKIKQEDLPEMDKYLPFDEAKNIMKSLLIKRRHKKTKIPKLFMKESDYDEVLVQLNKRLVSNIVRGLVNKGVVESAFDDEKNDFIFWVKDKYNEYDDQQPETD
jgi:hypothetical protein|tara:strand:+ start:25 stop:495 length:471 start_codon:yes stop_codon:yes gene_type:complete